MENLKKGQKYRVTRPGQSFEAELKIHTPTNWYLDGGVNGSFYIGQGIESQLLVQAITDLQLISDPEEKPSELDLWDIASKRADALLEDISKDWNSERGHGFKTIFRDGFTKGFVEGMNFKKETAKNK